jgi:hypothetical protein
MRVEAQTVEQKGKDAFFDNSMSGESATGFNGKANVMFFAISCKLHLTY